MESLINNINVGCRFEINNFVMQTGFLRAEGMVSGNIVNGAVVDA